MTANKTKWVRLGDYIEEVDERNTDLSVSLSQGIANTKVFQEPKQVSSNSKSDKIVRTGQFAYNRATTRNGEKISIAYRIGADCTVSSAYCVFKVTKEDLLDPYFLWMFFSRSEFDRYARYLSKGSAHEFFDWEEMCRVRIPLPSMEVQRELVATYEGLKRLAEDNEALIAPLTEACQAFIVDCKRQYPSVPLGDYIEEVDERNTEGKSHPFCGVNKDKCFMPTVADTNNLNSKKYKLVKQDMFVFSGMQTGRDVCVRIAYQNKAEVLLVSPAYTTYKVKDTSVILPQFLYMQFARQEMDRLGWFLSDGSIRSNLDWDRFCAIHIPLPPLEVQQSIVNLYHCIEEAKSIAREARDRLTTLCPALVQYAINA